MIRSMSILAVLLALGSFAAAGALAQDHPMAGQHAAMAGHEAMAAHHAQMMAQMQASQARLDTMVEQMNAAEGAARIDAMAAVLTEMASQRKDCAAMMQGMHDKPHVHEPGR